MKHNTEATLHNTVTVLHNTDVALHNTVTVLHNTETTLHECVYNVFPGQQYTSPDSTKKNSGVVEESFSSGAAHHQSLSPE